MLRRMWASRWVRAALVAALVAAWPAWVLFQPVGDAEHANLDFVLEDMHGQEVDLAVFRGRPLVVNFWATWCGPCKDEIPTFIELVDEYKDEQFTVLGISYDDPPEDLVPFAEQYGINYPVLVGLDREDVMEAYSAGFFLPVSWFVRADGTVATKHAGTNTKEWFRAEVAALVRDSEPAVAP